ncbi:MAG TPA: EAL domain-containing protein, partial [Roseiarcus sp.]|nr:EAL domain-containing protein [Roseiarcus sp.]
MAVDAEARADQRIYTRALEIFVARDTLNTYLGQAMFVLVAVAGYSLHVASIFVIAIIQVMSNQLVRNNLVRFTRGLRIGELDLRLLRHIELIYYVVGFVWAMALWPLAEAADGLRMLLGIVSAGGLLTMANTTSCAPRIFLCSIIGYSLGLTVAVLIMTTMPSYVLAGVGAVFIGVLITTGGRSARQVIQMLQAQVERDIAIEEQQRTITALDSARSAATRMAETDILTGLANRLLFMKTVDGMIATGKRISLTLLDVDLFKNINDALGHSTGDKVLKVVGGALSAFMEGRGFAARLGGDEFALIADRDEIQLTGDEIVSAIASKIDSLRTAAPDLPAISITGGSASFPQDATNGSDLLAAADIAQHEAKKSRRGGHVDYSVRLANVFHRETQLSYALREAIEAHAHFLCFQPKINLSSGLVQGAEVLSRFTSESLSEYSLEEIFDAAENRGLGPTLDEMVLDRFREALVALRDEHSLLLPASVNLSGSILKTPERLLAKLNRMTADGLRPQFIRMEITENAIYGRGSEAVVGFIDQIVKLGFTFALDDFGTGSGTLQHLMNLPVSELKIDKSFVSGMNQDR